MTKNKIIEETTKKSQSGSKIFPILDFSFKILATRPSSQSLIMAKITKIREKDNNSFFNDKKIGIDNKPLKIEIEFEKEKITFFFLIK